MSDASSAKAAPIRDALRKDVQTEARARPVRVMVVDDSHLMGWLLTRWIGDAQGMELVGIAETGLQAIETIAEKRPDVVLLDLEMPEMGGLEALPHLLKAFPAAKIIVVSALTKDNVAVALDALSRGASDYISKPDSAGDAGQAFRQKLIKRIEAIMRQAPAASMGRNPVDQLDALRFTYQGAERALRSQTVRHPFSMVVPRVIGVGSSTGGPEALLQFFKALPKNARRVPFLVAQHMPAEFTTTLAARLGAATGMPAKEGEDGELVQPGHIYLAPGDRHMTLVPSHPPVLSITDDPPLRYYRPSVDLLFRSLVAVYGPAVLGVVLTGMGADGAEGAQLIANSGGSTLVQDASSSVVWGMPGAVSEAGFACAEGAPIRLAEIAGRLFQGERP